MTVKSRVKKVAVLGDGGWGTTIAIHLARKGVRVTLWGAFPAYLRELEEHRENRKFLSGFRIPESVVFEKDAAAAVTGAGTVFLAVPSKYLAGALSRVTPEEARSRLVVIMTKGLDEKSGRLLSEVVHEHWGSVSVAAVSGPCISREVAAGEPTAVVAASHSRPARRAARTLLATDALAVLESDDLIGVQLGGAVKNVMAIAAGILDGLGYGTNAKSILLARGVAEIARLGMKMGAKRHTFLGLSGMGDLATTAFSIHSRNHGCGFEIGKGAPLKKVLASTEMAIEGVQTARAVRILARRFRVRMPIAEAVYEVLFGGKNPRCMVRAILDRDFINEVD